MVGTPTDKFIMLRDGTIYSLPEPTTHEEIANRVGQDPEQLFNTSVLGVVNDDGGVEVYQNGAGVDGNSMSSYLSSHFGRPFEVTDDKVGVSTEDRWGISNPSAPSGMGSRYYDERRRNLSPDPRSFAEQNQDTWRQILQQGR